MPRPLVSLWDMREILANDIASLSYALAQLQHVPDGRVAADALSPGAFTAVQDAINTFAEFCDRLGMTVSSRVVKRTCKYVQGQVTYAKITADAQHVSICIAEEMESRKLLYFDTPELANYYDHGPEPFGPAVAQNFPSAAYDIREACKCLGLGRDTAAVFHLMRVTEHAMRALAREVQITLDPSVSNWHNVIEQIIGEIAKLQQAPKTAARDAQLQSFSEAAVEFRHFKDAWRNHVSHSKAIYDPDTSMKVMRHVKSLMEHLAKNGLTE